MRLPGGRPRRAAGGALAILAVAGLLIARGISPARAARTDVRIAASTPGTLDPAAQSDINSAALSAQLFESLTAFDTNLVLRPALAASWDVAADGRRVVFHLRTNLQFSDGSPLTAADVVRSWLRVLDPAAPSPLATLMLEVTGARDYLSGVNPDPGAVGIHASGSDVSVDLDRPGADFPSIVASPTFAVVPRFECPTADLETGLGQCGVSSGGYVLAGVTDTEMTLTANSHYWAGPPAIATIHLVTDIGGRSQVEVFADGDLDYTPIFSNDASWVRFDRALGRQLRTVPSLSLTYLGFDTTRPPFSDARVRQAIGKAVDWTRIVELVAGQSVDGGSDAIAATSMVPPGIPGRDEASWLPTHDPVAARALLTAAGFPGGAGFPAITLAGAGGIGSGIAADLKRELGITVRLESYDSYFARLASDPPAMWTLTWIADYPGANDFLGVLLGSGASGNYGGWSSSAFDTAVDEALATRDPVGASAAFGRALGIVRSDVPVVPLDYPGQGWALSRDGLLGAGVNGLGIPRYAGLAWAP